MTHHDLETLYREMQPTPHELVEELFEFYLDVREDRNHPDFEQDRQLILRRINQMQGNEVTKRVNTLMLTLMREDLFDDQISTSSLTEYQSLYDLVARKPHLAIPSYFYQIYEELGLTCVENFQWIPRYLPGLSDLLQAPATEDFPLEQLEGPPIVITHADASIPRMPKPIMEVFQRVINTLLQPYPDHIRELASEIQQKVLQNLQVRQREASDRKKPLLTSPTQVLNLLKKALNDVMKEFDPGLQHMPAPLTMRGDTSTTEGEKDVLSTNERKALMDHLNTTDLSKPND